ncbi:hypothetical protein [Alcaligenes faecalis]|uniref:hypothetical protein n=1 Tax=Alcaligenes faecalis TaxID=511 RepID=UPI001C830921|nr:hypothetical protein [Alcaligenes faecalis]MBX6964442.1 hypothetical protein [Providencia rettgeri]MBX7032528.1 hypothetical protein [Alcaligenes faecalis]
MLINSSTPKPALADTNINQQQPIASTATQSFQAVLATASTQVTISPAAQQQTQVTELKHGSFAMRNIVSKMDEKERSDFLKDIVYEGGPKRQAMHEILVDITDWLKGGPMYYSNTREPVTEESTAYFLLADGKYQAEKVALYELELSKGTPLIDIYDKLSDLTSKQPARLLGMRGYLVKPT